MGRAAPHEVARHVHPAVKPEAAPPAEATGIDYLRLLEAAHHDDAGQAINFAALADDPDHPDAEEQP